MNLSVMLGFISGFGLVLFGMITGGTSISQVTASFVDIPSVFITFGGAFSATVMAVPTRDLKSIPKYIKVLLRKEKTDLNEYIDVIEELAKEARMKGLLVLEEKIENIEVKDDFLKFCVMLIVDAIEPTKVRSQIENEMDCIESRHGAAWNVFDTCGSFGPSFGMLGTLIGLINMLANMDASGGADSLGKGMACALVTTFYGSVLVNMICAPISYRLKAKHEEEMIAKDLIKEGVLSIQSGENPKYIREKLSSYIAYTERAKITAEAETNVEAKVKKRGFAGRRSKQSQENNA